jgi:hypothetical protein
MKSRPDRTVVPVPLCAVTLRGRLSIQGKPGQD